MAEIKLAVEVVKELSALDTFDKSGADYIDLRAAVKSLSVEEASVDVNSGSGNDRIFTGHGNDTIVAGTGDDFVDAGAGDDNVTGGAGNDTIYGGAGNDVIDGGIGDDWLYGGNDDDFVTGGSGNDLIWGESGNDTLKGDAGNDLLSGGSGKDTLTGGAGRDTFQYWVDNSQKSINLQSAWGVDRITDFKAGTAADSDRLDLSSFWARFDDSVRNDFVKALNFSISGNGVNGGSYTYGPVGEYKFPISTDKNTALNLAQVKSLDNTEYAITISYQKEFQNIDGKLQINLSKMSGEDTLITLENINSNTTFDTSNIVADTQKIAHGTAKGETLDFASVTSKGVQAYGFDGNDTITGTSKADQLLGGDGNDNLNGGAGNDSRLEGGNGNDAIDGGDGNDNLIGGAGNDSLFGGQGNDWLYGGKGTDVLNGGTGNDTFLIGGSVVIQNGKAVLKFDGNVVIEDFKFDFQTKIGDTVKFATEIVGWDLSKSTFNQSVSVQSVINSADFSTGNLVISDGFGSTLTLNNVALPDAAGQTDNLLLNLFGLA